MTTLPPSRVIFEGSRVLSAVYQLGDEPRSLQSAFGSLFDEAANAVFLAGFDLDEVLVERLFIVHRGKKKAVEIRADFLADAKLLKISVVAHLGVECSNAADIEIRAVKIVARYDMLWESEPGVQVTGGSR